MNFFTDWIEEHINLLDSSWLALRRGESTSEISTNIYRIHISRYKDVWIGVYKERTTSCIVKE